MTDFNFTVRDGRVTYSPWTNGRCVGFRCQHSGGEVEYIYLNPSRTTESGDTPNVFLYQGNAGDPGRDYAAHHYIADGYNLGEGSTQ